MQVRVTWSPWSQGNIRTYHWGLLSIHLIIGDNTWGALSLDHVFEFMGGMNTAIKQVTGKDPDAYFADYRNRKNMRMQELKEAVGVEARATIFNPKYIKEKMKGKITALSCLLIVCIFSPFNRAGRNI